MLRAWRRDTGRDAGWWSGVGQSEASIGGYDQSEVTWSLESGLGDARGIAACHDDESIHLLGPGYSTRHCWWLLLTSAEAGDNVAVSIVSLEIR